MRSRAVTPEPATAVDILNIAIILLLTMLVTILRHESREDTPWLLGIFVTLLVFTVLSLRFSNHGTYSRVLHDFSPALLVVVIFNAVGPVIERANAERWDLVFAALDLRVFGTLAVLWHGLLRRPSWFTDLSYVAYCTYYVAPIALAILLYRRPADGEFRLFVFTLVLTFYAAYALYFLFPTLGPRLSAADERTVIGGGAVSDTIRAFVHFAERNHTDAFPSGHTAGALVCLYFARRYSRGIFLVFLPVAGGIIFSTVYLYYHYIIDVVAGAALAGACVHAGLRLQPVLEPQALKQRFSMYRWPTESR